MVNNPTFVQPSLGLPDLVWLSVADGNAAARALYTRHYSYRRRKDGITPLLFVGPGEKLVLLHTSGKALLIWRKFISMDNQEGVSCAVFRNEGAGLSSALLRSGMALAWQRWPGTRLYTYVDTKKIASLNPGYCFKRAGWRQCGVTKGGLLVFDVRPDEVCYASKNKSPVVAGEIGGDAAPMNSVPRPVNSVKLPQGMTPGVLCLGGYYAI